MAVNGVFKLTKRFEEGYNKDDVLEYVADLLNQNNELKKKLQEFDSNVTIDESIVHKLEDEIKSLKAKIDEGNIQIQRQEALLASEKSVREKLQKQFAEEKQRLSAELAQASSENGESETLIEQIKARDEEIENLVEKIKNLENEVSEKENIIFQKETDITKLNSEIKEIKENTENGVQSTFDIQNVFIEAQNTAKKYTVEAKKAADKLVDDANEQASKIINEANEIADKTVSDAKKQADDTAKTAQQEAFDKLKDINEKKLALSEMTENIKKLLLADIEAISDDIAKTSEFISKMNEEVQQKISNAQEKIDNANTTVANDSMINEIIEKIKAESNIVSPVEILPDFNINNEQPENIDDDNEQPENIDDDNEQPENIDDDNEQSENIDDDNEQSENIDDEIKNVPTDNNIEEVQEDISAESGDSVLISEDMENIEESEISKIPPVKNTKFSPQDWGIDLEALTKEIEEEESKKQEIEEE